MKIVQIVPRARNRVKLKTLLKKTELELRNKKTTFTRISEGKWRHIKYPGWINWNDIGSGIVIAEIKTRNLNYEWQVLQAFIGYLGRNLSKHIESISIYFR